jgi:hypothetical protein
MSRPRLSVTTITTRVPAGSTVMPDAESFRNIPFALTSSPFVYTATIGEDRSAKHVWAFVKSPPDPHRRWMNVTGSSQKRPTQRHRPVPR